MKMNGPHGRAGFTLIEMLFVLVIIGLLAALLVPRLVGKVGQSKSAIAKATIAQLAQNVEAFNMAVGRYPTEQEGLTALVKKPDGVDTWAGPYWDRATLPKDPWGGDYQYKLDEKFGFVIRSFGADAKVGGEGDAADIDNRQ
jgi:general secretion pathway protein G